jgi:hypothetical protein
MHQLGATEYRIDRARLNALGAAYAFGFADKCNGEFGGFFAVAGVEG